jgi:ring-1,2-phenylacetyl-CoA epoxidase subunit PaaC
VQVLDAVASSWKKTIGNIFQLSGLSAPPAQMVFGGKEGQHTQHLETLLHEMQYMQRTYPGMEW